MIVLKKIKHTLIKNSFSILSIIFCIVLLFSIASVKNRKEEILQVSFSLNDSKIKSLELSLKQDDYVVQEEKIQNEFYDICIYYPVTKYKVLNKEIETLKTSIKKQFLDSIDEKLIKETNIPWSLNLNFNSYSYMDIIGFAFHTDVFTGGAHPNAYINTINYNKEKNKIINIDTLIGKNSNILNVLSDYTYKKLSENEYIKEGGLEDMLKDGTKPTKENFSNFVFTPNGLMVFFEKYQVGPYVLGEFTVTVPYDIIGIDNECKKCV